MGTRLVLASFNKGKRREVSRILHDIDVLSPPDFGIAGLPPEDGSTFLENAVIKAAFVAFQTRMMAVGDDSGLEVEALEGRPGVHSARFAGPDADDAANIDKLLAELESVGNRKARFACTAVLVVPFQVEPAVLADVQPVQGIKVIQVSAAGRLPDGFSAFAACGTVEGEIIDDRRGHDGFGYDPVFLVPSLGLTFAEIPPDLKNDMSHRGKAFRALAPLIARISDRGWAV